MKLKTITEACYENPRDLDIQTKKLFGNAVTF